MKKKLSKNLVKKVATSLLIVNIAISPIQTFGANTIPQTVVNPNPFTNFKDWKDNAGGVTITDLFGVTRQRLLDHLSEHENDDYYLGTPYIGGDWTKPNGNYNNPYGLGDGSKPGMNCTGFVWHAIWQAGAWKMPEGANAVVPRLKGWVNTIKKENVHHYSYDSIDKMFADGKLQKGDIIWLFTGGGYTTIDPNHHVGFFWGDSPSENKWWDSVEKTNNSIKEIECKVPIKEVWVIPWYDDVIPQLPEDKLEK